MLLYIHSAGRPDDQPTLEALIGAGLAEQTRLVVQDSQKRIYEKHWRGHVAIIALPKRITTLSPTRQWILDKEAGHFVLLDDDLRFFVRRKDDATKFLPAKPADIRRMVAAMDKALNKFAHVGLCAREGGNRMLADAQATRMMRILGYDAPRVKAAKGNFDRLPTKQDFDMTLQLLRAGLPNLVLHSFVHDQGGSQAAGGCSVYRTNDMMVASAHGLAALHPGFVKVVTKATKTAWGGGERTDVQISWKKALKEGQDAS